MQTCVVSDDLRVITLVRETIDRVAICSSAGDTTPQADLYIWDLEADSAIPSQLLDGNSTHRLLLLAEQKQLASLDASLLSCACILLKPLNPSTLSTFIDFASKAWEQRQNQSQAEELRSDRDALLEYVLAANLRLQENDHHRTNFLARALHDLRAPLTAIHGYCGLLADGQLGPVNPRQRELLSRMQSSAKRLSRQGSGMFELSVLGSVRRKPQLLHGDVEECVSQALEELHSVIDEKAIRLSVHTESPDASFFFEAEQITQVLINLLENCCKFTPSGGAITVRGYPVAWDPNSRPPVDIYTRASPALNAYRLDISDTGPSIQQQLLPAIFEEYTSYSGSGGRDRSGGGLGLAICKMIVNAHDGCIWANNSDAGALFSFILPFQPVSVALQLEPEGATCGR